MDEFERIFQNVTSVVLGQKLEGYKEHANWLGENVWMMEKTKSVVSGTEFYYPPYSFYRDIESRIVTVSEAFDIVGKRQLRIEQLASLTLANATESLKEISIATPSSSYGNNTNIVECCLYADAHDCFKSSLIVRSQRVIYTFWPRQSEYCVGCQYIFSSQFCLKCYNSENLTRCFEMSDCNNCSDSLFCYNCENLTNCMFCFNTKSKKYAIANVEVGREKYLEIKSALLKAFVKTLQGENHLGCNIFNLTKKH